MSDLAVIGLGAISPAGWGVPALRAAVGAGIPLPPSSLARPGWTATLPVRRVPTPATRPAFLAHPRLRRASPISHFAVAAALEALGQPWSAPITPVPEPGRLGLVFCTMTGSVLYSRRFYEEARRDPATASPLLFPETVFNAPASHLAALLGLGGRVHTEVGDATSLPGAFVTAALWLDTGLVDRCLLVAAEESDWLSADGLVLHHRHAVAAEGAGALLLARAAASGPPALARLTAVSQPRRYSPSSPSPLPPPFVAGPEDLLVDDTRPAGTGRRRTPREVLGEGWAAGAAWQCVEAVAAVAAGEAQRGIVSVTGTYGDTVAVLFESIEAATAA